MENQKKGVIWKVLEESIYRRDREDRIQQAFELIVPDLAQKAVEDKLTKEKSLSDKSVAQEKLKITRSQ